MLLVLLTAQASVLHCAAEVESYTRHVWQAPDGLPEQTVQAFAQTPDGFLWIGTTGGLLRFDGARFTLFDRQNTPTLRENNIFCLTVVHDGSLWIGTEGGGLAHYAKGQFQSWSTRDGLSNDFVRTIVQTGDGTIWAGTDNGLLRLQGNRFVRIDSTPSIPSLAVHSIYPDRAGHLWVGGSRLLQLDGNSAREFTLPGEASQNRVKCILQTTDGSLWVGTVSGLNRIPPGAAQFQPVPGISTTVRVLRETSNHTLWIGTIGQGVYTLRAGVLDRMTAPAQLPSNTVLNLFEDSEGNLWIGTQAGMLRLSRSAMNILPLPQPNDADFGTVYQDHDGSLWIGSTHLFHLRDGTVTPETLPGLSSAHVRNVFRDRSGTLWVGTDGDGVYRLSAGSPVHLTTGEGLSNNFVRAFAQDRDGSMWVANDEGINHLISSGDRVRVVSYGVKDGLAYFSTRALLEDRHGDLWIGTDSGLSHLQNGSFVQDVATSALAQAKIWSVHEDPDGGLWFGTRNNGLFRYRDGKLAHFTTKEGLASNAIYQILEDASGHLWVSGPPGVARLNRAELDAQADSPSHPLAIAFYPVADLGGAVEIYGGTQPSGCIGQDGSVWFPSNRGPIHITPGGRSGLPAPPLHLESVLADGSSLPMAPPLHLRAGTARVEFSYEPVRLGSQQSLRFRYRLTGFDPDWSPVTAQRTADYTNLPPGHYRFEVQVFQVDSPQAVSQASIDLIQTPRFYRTWWFLSLIASLVALTTYLFYLSRVRQVRARFEAVLEERSRVAREMHDTVIQGCTGVSALLEAISMNEADEAPRHSLMDFARTQIRTTIGEARDAIWNLRKSPESPTSLSETIQSMGNQIAAEFNGRLSFRLDGTPYAVNQPVAHDLLMVAREAVLNAVLHGKSRNVNVSLIYARRQLTLSVADDGCGFDPQLASSAEGHHFGLRGMRERVQRCGGKFRLNAQPGRGVQIEVVVPRTR